MGYLKYVKNLKGTKEHKKIQRERLLKFRKEPTNKRIKRPTRLARARSLGYKAKEGFVIVRQKVKRGGRQNKKLKAGRKSSNTGRTKNLNKNYQTVAEQRSKERYPNLEVLNSYEVLKDGKHIWFEVILIDRMHPNINKDENLSNLARKAGRVERGLTSSSRKSRGLRKKGRGSEKTRLSGKKNI